MKKQFTFHLILVIGAWLVAVIFATICLLSCNEFKVMTLERASLVIFDSDEIEPVFLE